MKRVIIAAIVLGLSGSVHAVECADFWTWVEAGCRHVVDTYENGDNALLLSGYAWHLPGTWTSERRAMENENAWGGGWAHSLEKPNGDTENVFFLVFEDSHRQPQYNLGYSWSTYWLDRNGIQPGLGFTAMIIRRPDVAGGWPVPVVLPLFSLRHQKLEVITTYIPKLNGGVNHGSILYVFGKIDLK